MAGGRAVRDHCHRLAGGVGGVHLDLDVEHGRQAAQALRANAQRVDFFKQLNAQRLHLAQRSAGSGLGLQLVHVQVVHQAFLGHDDGFFRGAANANAQHARRAPAGAHGGHGFQHPVHDAVAGVQHGELAFVFTAAALGRHRHFQGVAGHQFRENHRWCVVFGVFAVELRVGHHRRPKRVVGVVVTAAHAFVDGVIHAAGETFPAHVHANFQKHIDDAGVLANRPVACGAHFAIGQNLRHGIFGRRAFFSLVGPRQVGNVVRRMVITDVLQGSGNRLDQVGLADGGVRRGHGAFSIFRGWQIIPDLRSVPGSC